MWPCNGDDKGPTEKDWPQRFDTLADYYVGARVGILTGEEISPGKVIHDVDIDWAAGSQIALKLGLQLPSVRASQQAHFTRVFHIARGVAIHQV